MAVRSPINPMNDLGYAASPLLPCTEVTPPPPRHPATPSRLLSVPGVKVVSTLGQGSAGVSAASDVNGAIIKGVVVEVPSGDEGARILESLAQAPSVLRVEPNHVVTAAGALASKAAAAPGPIVQLNQTRSIPQQQQQDGDSAQLGSSTIKKGRRRGPGYTRVLSGETVPSNIERIAAVVDGYTVRQPKHYKYDVAVAVVDTGIDEHPDLNVVEGLSFVEGDPDPSDGEYGR